MLEHQATLNLANLIKGDVSAGGEVSGAGELTPDQALLEADGLRLAEPLEWQLTVHASGGDDYVLTGSVSGVAVQECRRCLSEVKTPLRTEFIFPMSYVPGKELTIREEEDGEERLVFGHSEVDFTALLTQLLAIDLPLTVLCGEDCRGLALDGVNLNDHPEHHSETDTRAPSPFAVLEELEV
jgi:uncharacterized metal-binding protein YceD (DUF177 family)